ncbi:GNAT family N-acetyltransferase [Kiloniella sp. EL199]|uniref:GNAT family N-acetyltransferase n=1 Tax=Kiloniella sp. EL199 TaxID=2107581 RepID=UPI000EA3D510|nr:GNAT family protein [Kiloniella sp. EL199]
MSKNSLGQPIGPIVQNWTEPQRPTFMMIAGRYCKIERLDPLRHTEDLFEANSLCKEDQIWTYLAYGPFDKLETYREWITDMSAKDDPLFYAIVDKKTNKALGVASYLRITPTAGSIEVGHINFSPALQKTVMATEAMYLMMHHVFVELGYRRYEWKCNALNEGSKVAAKRLGFTYEGTFRQSDIVKGRNRDTAWFSILDSEWPIMEQAFTRWLIEDNFTVGGKQITSLSDFAQEIWQEQAT